jgi:hypothetical protein
MARRGAESHVLLLLPLLLWVQQMAQRLVLLWVQRVVLL